jgi:hypothetical protein
MNKTCVRIGAIAMMAAGCSAVAASPVSEWRYIGGFQSATSTSGLAATGFQDAHGLATQFDASSWTADSGGSAVQAAPLTLADQTAQAATDGRERAMSASVTANTSPVVGTPAALDLTLWNFIANIRAQQVGDQFVTLRTSSANIDYTLNGMPPPVPLPASSWLFLAGLGAWVVLRSAMRRSGTRRPDMPQFA